MPDINKIDLVQKLAEYDLTIYPLNALKNQATSYTIGIIQPLEDVIANDYEVRNSDTQSITLKYNNFFQKLFTDQRELVLSPEYSCPWQILSAQFDNNFPARGVLWIIGCESISIDNLKQFINENEEKVSF